MVKARLDLTTRDSRENVAIAAKVFALIEREASTPRAAFPVIVIAAVSRGTIAVVVVAVPVSRAAFLVIVTPAAIRLSEA